MYDAIKYDNFLYKVGSIFFKEYKLNQDKSRTNPGLSKGYNPDNPKFEKSYESKPKKKAFKNQDQTKTWRRLVF